MSSHAFKQSNDKHLDTNCSKTNHVHRRQNKACKFDYHRILDESGYTLDNNYGYQTDGPLVILKLNKIFNWVPRAYDNKSFESLPDFLQTHRHINQTDFQKLISENIIISCDGEYAADIDAYRRLDLLYMSDRENPYATEFGLIPFYYYPYTNQEKYQQPLVFLKLKFDKENSPRNKLIHVMCKAYAANIDSNDKHGRRGMTIFSLFVGK
jgi:sodium/potassium-transporting ATPase subunit beta